MHLKKEIVSDVFYLYSRLDRVVGSNPHASQQPQFQGYKILKTSQPGSGAVREKFHAFLVKQSFSSSDLFRL